MSVGGSSPIGIIRMWMSLHGKIRPLQTSDFRPILDKIYMIRLWNQCNSRETLLSQKSLVRLHHNRSLLLRRKIIITRQHRYFRDNSSVVSEHRMKVWRPNLTDLVAPYITKSTAIRVRLNIISDQCVLYLKRHILHIKKVNSEFFNKPVIFYTLMQLLIGWK